MTKYVVHIGNGNCGSSAIQTALFGSRNELRDRGIVYETATPRNGHFNFVALAGRTSRGQESSDTAVRIAQDSIARIRDALRPGNTVLLSAESLFNLSPGSLIEILSLIDPEIERLDLIAYVCAPQEMYLSQVQQIIKADSRFPLPDAYAPRIDRMLACWQDCTDVHSLTVHNFDRGRLIDGDVVADFRQVLGELTGQRRIGFAETKVNVTLSAEQVVALHDYRTMFLKEHDGRTHRDSQQIISYFETLNALGFPGSAPALTDEAAAEVERANEEIVRSVNARFPKLGLVWPVIDTGSREPAGWKVDGSVAQILATVDADILALIRLLVPRFQVSMTRADIGAMVAAVRAQSQARDVDAKRVLAETLQLWRTMGFPARADILAPLVPEEAAAPAAPGPTETQEHPMIVFGKGDWLFLKSDRNRVMEQIAGIYPLSPDFTERWCALFEHRAEMARRIGYQYFYGIAPNKECVYFDHLPDHIVVMPDRPVRQVLNAAAGRVTHRYYLDTLLAARTGGEDLFVTGDTHWNHVGALVAFNAAMDAIGLPRMSPDEFLRETRDIKADLSIKIGRLCPATVLTVREPRFRLVENNKVTNIGQRRVYENDDKTLPTCVCFRDSFTSHQLEMFASRFSRLVFLWQPNIDYDIVRLEAPDVVINQQVERFLVDCPDDLQGPSHSQYVAEKQASTGAGHLACAGAGKEMP